MQSKTHTFTIDFYSAEEDFTFAGQFTCKKLSIMDFSRVQTRKSQLAGGYYTVRDDEGNPTGKGIDEGTEMLNYMLAMLEVALIQKPDWWDLNKLSDQGLISKVFEEVMRFENSFRGRGNAGTAQGNQHGQGGQNSGTPQPTASQPVDVTSKMVGTEIHKALDA